jgi:hypothetical protein
MALKRIITEGRFLMLEQKAVLLSEVTLNFVKDITCYLFNDGLLLAYRGKNVTSLVRTIVFKIN